MAEKRMYGEGIRTCGNGGWHGNACKASGFVPAEMRNGGKTHVRQAAIQAQRPEKGHNRDEQV